MVRALTTLTALAVALALGCGDSGESTGDGNEPAESERAELLRAEALSRGLAPLPMHEQTAAPLAEVGRLLFFDPILGGELDVACATCHHPDFGFADATDLPIGVAGVGLGPERGYPEGANHRPLGELRPLGRNSPTMLNLRTMAEDARARGLEPTFNWDGRIVALAQFAHTPVRDRDEMRGDAFGALDTQRVLLERINAIDEYRERFSAVAPEVAVTGIESVHLERALTQFILSLATGPNDLDRFLDGGPAPDDTFLDGLALFLELDCVSCHSGVAMTDHQFHRTGAPPNTLSRPFQVGIDIGRQEPTGAAADRYAFRTAPLRDVARTAPYMHSGMLESLEDVVRFYTSGENHLAPYDDGVGIDDLERGTPRALSDDEVAALVRFLEGVSASPEAVHALSPVPDEVPSGLAPAAIELVP